MDLKKNNSQNQDSVPILDDAWWNSLLESANKYPNSAGGDQANSNETNEISEIDWFLMERYFHDDEILKVEVIGFNKGGLLVKGDHFKGFIPNSHLKEVSRIQSTPERYQALKEAVGQHLKVKVIECDKGQGKLIFSERAAEKEPGRRLDVFDDLDIGSVVKGEVTNITKFGVFLDLGGIEGLVHLSELSWGKVHHPSEIVHIGEVIQARVISIDKEKMRIALSIKQLLPNPWYDFGERCLVGDVITVTITRVVGYGVFAEIENGIEGLVHISDIQSKDLSLSIVEMKVGEKMVVSIKAIDVENRRLSLGFISRL